MLNSINDDATSNQASMEIFTEYDGVSNTFTVTKKNMHSVMKRLLYCDLDKLTRFFVINNTIDMNIELRDHLVSSEDVPKNTIGFACGIRRRNDSYVEFMFVNDEESLDELRLELDIAHLTCVEAYTEADWSELNYQFERTNCY